MVGAVHEVAAGPGPGVWNAGRRHGVRAAGCRRERVVSGARAALSGHLIVDVGELDVEGRGDSELGTRDALLAEVEISGVLAVSDLIIAGQVIVLAVAGIKVVGIDLGRGTMHWK